MAPDNPISMEELDQIELTRDEDLAMHLVQEGKDDLASREKWENKINLMHRKRYGIRRSKSFPWPNASNLNIPMVDKTIRRLKPGFVNLVFNTRPIVSFDPVSGEDAQNARKAELFFDWLLRTHMDNFFLNVTRGVDLEMERGFVVWKNTWDYQSRMVSETIRRSELSVEEQAGLNDPNIPMDQKVALIIQRVGLDLEEDADLAGEILQAFFEGEDEFTFEKEEAFVNKPKSVSIKPQDIIVPPDTTDLSTARRIIHRMFMTRDDLQRKQADDIYKDVEFVDAVKSKDLEDQLITSQEDREGINDLDREGEIVEIWEIYSWQHINGEDKPAVKSVMTVDPNSMTVLRNMELPFEHGEWPFVQIKFEENEDRYYSSRGVVEMLDDVATEINVQHNAKLDRMTIANAPMILVRSGSGISGKNIRFIPGQTIRTQRPGEDIVPFQFPIIDASFQTEELILKSWGEEYIGDPSFGNAGINQTGEAPTATEVNAIEQNSNLIFSLDGRIFQEGMKKNYEQIWALWNQFGPERIWVRTMNSPPLNMTRDEIQGQYDLRPTGTVASTNPVLEAQKALSRMQILQGNPLIRQDELIRDYLEKDDLRVAERLLKTPEEIQADNEAAAALEAQEQEAQQNPSVDQMLSAAQTAKRNGARTVRA